MIELNSRRPAEICSPLAECRPLKRQLSPLEVWPTSGRAFKLRRSFRANERECEFACATWRRQLAGRELNRGARSTGGPGEPLQCPAGRPTFAPILKLPFAAPLAKASTLALRTITGAEHESLVMSEQCACAIAQRAPP